MAAERDRTHHTRTSLKSAKIYPSGRREESENGRLEMHWKRICQQESHSKDRNKSLLDDFERVEQHAAALANKLQRLKAVRDQYEDYISKMYPSWREELEQHRLTLQQERSQVGDNNTGKETTGRRSDVHPVPSYRPANGHTRFQSPERLISRHPAHSESPTQTNEPYRSYTEGMSANISPTRLAGLNTRYFTGEWDPYYPGNPSFNHVDPRQVPPMHMPQRYSPYHPMSNGFASSTPYHAMHRAPLDPRVGYNQSLDMSYPGPGYHMMPPAGMYHPGHPHMQGHGGGMLAGDGGMGVNGRCTEEVAAGTPNREGNPLERGDIVPTTSGMTMRGTSGHILAPKPVAHETEKQRDAQVVSAINSQPAPLHYTANDLPEKPLEPNSSPPPTKLARDLNHGQSHPETLAPPRKYSMPEVVKNVKRNDEEIEREPMPRLKEAVASSDVESSPLSLNDLQHPISSKDVSNFKTERNAAANKEVYHQQGIVPRVDGLDEEDAESLLDVGSCSSGLSEGSDSEMSLPDESLEAGRRLQEDGATRKPSLSGDSGGAAKEPEKSTNEAFRSSERKENLSTNVDEKLSRQNNEDPEKHMAKAEQKKEIASEVNVVESALSDLKLSEDSNPSKTRRITLPSPSVSVDEFLALLQVVDADVEVSFSPETLYHSPRCSDSMKENIIECVRHGESLGSYDPSSISMIVLEELPRLVTASTKGFLIPDEVFSSARNIRSNGQLRAFLDPSMVKLWGSLFSHLTNLVRNSVMSTDETAATFAPTLMSIHSQYNGQCQALLCHLIKAALDDGPDSSDAASPRITQAKVSRDASRSGSRDDPLDEASVTSEESSTLGSTPPRQLQSNPSAGRDRTASLERTLSYEDDFEEENIPLNETEAYKKLMSSAKSDAADDISDILGESGSRNHENEADDDDDVERTLARSISPPAVSPRTRSPAHTGNITPEKKKQTRQGPKLSLFGGGSLGLSYGSEDLGDSWGAESGKLSASMKSDKSEQTPRTDRTESDSSISPPLSPDLTPAYVPSAMDAPKPATTINRKPGFWNHSDTESEVDLQLSTGGQDAKEEDDDFDFYG